MSDVLELCGDTENHKLSGINSESSFDQICPTYYPSHVSVSIISTPKPEPPTEKELKYEDYAANCLKNNRYPLRATKECILSNSDCQEALDLDGHGCDPESINLLCSILCAPPFIEIKKINMDNNLFDQEACVQISNYVADSMKLESLNLNFCQLDSIGIQALMEAVDISQNIVELNLSHCGLPDESGAIIGKSLTCNETLQILNLSHNAFSQQTAVHLGALLSQNKNILKLNLSWNSFYPEGFINPLFKGIIQNETLLNLDLSWNSLSGAKFARGLKRLLIKNSTLQILNLEFNWITSEEITLFTFGLKKTQSLTTLYIGGNKLQQIDYEKLIKSISVTPITSLFLGDVSLSKEIINLVKDLKQTRPDVIIQFRGELLPNPPDPVDFRAILLDRCKFLSMKPKKKEQQRNFGHFMLLLQDNEKSLITQNEFLSLLAKFKAKLDKALINELMKEFTVKKNIDNFVNIKEMSLIYLDRHPTLPPPNIKKQPGGNEKKKKATPKKS